MSVIVLHL